jgi:hypothetical protein
LSGDVDGLHWGYYLDDPDNDATFLTASYYSNDAYELEIGSGNLFEVLRYHLEWSYEGSLENLEYDPDEAETYEAEIKQLAILRQAIQEKYTSTRQEIGQDYLEKYEPQDTRNVTAPTRDGLGIVVPSDAYRPLPEGDPYDSIDYEPTPDDVEHAAKDALHLLEQGYPGAALKLGKNLWTYKGYHPVSYSLLTSAYTALDRPLLRRMLDVARDYRADCDLRRKKV